MAFNFASAVDSKSVLRLPLNHLVYEICRLNRPSARDLALLYLHLLRQYVVADLFTRLPNVRPSPKHALVCHHAHCKVVHRRRMVLSAHHLRSHVSRRARRVLSILWPPQSRNAEVRDAQVTVVVDDKVLGLDVAMDDLLLVAVLEPGHQTRNKEAYKRQYKQ